MTDDLTPLDNAEQNSPDLLTDLQSIISRGKSQAVVSVNSALTLTYWHIGKRINADVLQGERGAYGKQVIPGLAEELVQEYGRSFEAKNLRRMMQFAEIFPDSDIVVPLVRQLSWSHFLVLIPLKTQDARVFYAEQAMAAGWSRRELRRQIQRKAVELKVGRFKAAFKGQMELYLNWLDKYERQPDEASPIGLILCAEAGTEQVELMNLQKDNIMVAEYWTELPLKEVLEKKLHTALIEIKARLAEGKNTENS